jgi:peptide/nickel transport system permease protein
MSNLVYEEQIPPLANSEDDQSYQTASQWQLMWWRFRKHRLAIVSTIILIVFYIVAIFAGFFTPHDPYAIMPKYDLAAPTPLQFFDEGGFRLRPFVYGYKSARDPVTLEKIYEIDTSVKYDISFFIKGAPYQILGVIESDIHLFGVTDPEGMVLLVGADDLGRDVFSRIVYGAQVSLSVGLIGVFLSLILGIIFGGISGYYGGAIDTFIQRLIEFLKSLPAIPLWLTLSAAVPPEWSATERYFAIILILSLIGWTDIARVVRGKFLSLREEDFILASKLIGASETRLIFIHMVPSFTSHLIASLSLSIPTMILSETALSFLGLGLQPPVISWGTLLKDGQNIRAIAQTPWLLTPALAVIITVLAFNFVGDGLRDAADPYSK